MTWPRCDLTGEQLSEHKFNFRPPKSRKRSHVIAFVGRVSRRPRSDGKAPRTCTTRRHGQAFNFEKLWLPPPRSVSILLHTEPGYYFFPVIMHWPPDTNARAVYLRGEKNKKHTQSSLTQQCLTAGSLQFSLSFKLQVAKQTINTSHWDPAAKLPSRSLFDLLVMAQEPGGF